MRAVLKSGFLWQVASGFALGAIGLVSLQPPEANRTLADHLATATHLAR